MKRVLIAIAIIVLGTVGIIALGDSQNKTNDNPTSQEPHTTFTKITPEEAKKMIGESNLILLDVRTEEEFAAEHIEGALLIPDDEIAERATAELPDKNATIIVYCRSGGRSQKAAEALAQLGYTKVYDMGGILDWPFETVKTSS